jgi:cell division protein FtsQ
MELRFVPRSGNFVVDLGAPSDYDTKLSNLYRFYNKGLDNVGWDKYRSISLRYEGQVVCR